MKTYSISEAKFRKDGLNLVHVYYNRGANFVQDECIFKGTRKDCETFMTGVI